MGVHWYSPYREQLGSYVTKLQMHRSVFLMVLPLKICPKVYLHTGNIMIYGVIYCSNTKRLERNYIFFQKKADYIKYGSSIHENNGILYSDKRTGMLSVI